MHKHIRYVVLLALLAVMLSVTTGYAMAAITPAASGANQVSVIEKMVSAMNDQDVTGYMSTFTQANRVDMEQAYNNGSAGSFFKEKSARLVNIKKLPADIGAIAAAISPNEDLDLSTTEVYYAELAFKVDKEDKWLYNGTNHRVIVMTNENGEWKISRISVPAIDYIVEKGQGFGTKAEKQALRIEDTMDKKGIVLNNQGSIIENIAASQAELAKERQGQVREQDVQASATTADLSTQGILTTTTDEHTRPSAITVYFTNSTNSNYWGAAKKSIDFYLYCQDVLPNEWIASWYDTAPTSVQCGALAVKMYGWYHVYHPKWNYSPYYADVKDSTADQVYVVNSRNSKTTQAINEVGGIGIDRPSGSSYILFETQYVAGTYDSSGQYGGYIKQWGSKYWADQGKGYTYMVHYYYDNSSKVGGSGYAAHFFYY